MGSPELAAWIRTGIDEGRFRSNERLQTHRMLAERFGVSRGTVRRAIQQLVAEGALRTRTGSGTFVVGAKSGAGSPYIEATRPLELMDARFAFEPHICRLAVLNAIRADFDDLESLLAAMEASESAPGRFAELDGTFHARLVATTGNSLLGWIAEQLEGVRMQPDWVRMRRITLGPGIIAQYNWQHRAIVDAIRNREPEAAAERMKEHLETARLSLTRAAAT